MPSLISGLKTEGKDLPKKRKKEVEVKKDKKDEEKPTLKKDRETFKGRAMREYLEVKEVTTKQKKNIKSISLFCQLRNMDEVVATVNLNINNIGPDGEIYIHKKLGVKIVPGTPIIMDLSIPKGNLLKDWKDAIKDNPAQTDLGDHDDS